MTKTGVVSLAELDWLEQFPNIRACLLVPSTGTDGMDSLAGLQMTGKAVYIDPLSDEYPVRSITRTSFQKSTQNVTIVPQTG
mgnify:CR=1 FL=1